MLIIAVTMATKYNTKDQKVKKNQKKSVSKREYLKRHSTHKAMSRLENLNKSPSSGERGGKRGERTLNTVFLAVRKAVRHILSVHVF